MANFNEILNNLHSQSTITDDAAETPIEITTKREFIVPEDYNLILAYAGDVNSQIVTFKLPKNHDEHDLSECSNRELRWKNANNGTEGISDLIKKSSDTSTWTAEWEVPPEIMTASGQIDIAISIYDII